MKNLFTTLFVLITMLPVIALSFEQYDRQQTYSQWQLNKLKSKHKNTQTNNAPAKKATIIIPAAEAEKRARLIERQQTTDQITGANRQERTWTDTHGNKKPLSDDLIAAEKSRLERSRRVNKSEKIRKLEENPSQYFYDEEVSREEDRSSPIIVNHW